MAPPHGHVPPRMAGKSKDRMGLRVRPGIAGASKRSFRNRGAKASARCGEKSRRTTSSDDVSGVEERVEAIVEVTTRSTLSAAAAASTTTSTQEETTTGLLLQAGRNDQDVLAGLEQQESMAKEPTTEKDKTSCCAQESVQLQQWSDMPEHLQFNPHILSGYRPLMTPAECLRSIFCLHNETVNILSHGFAIVYILVTVPQLLPWNNARGSLLTNFLSWCHLIGAVSPWIGSFLYHVFMNLDYGEPVYRCLLKLDMLGIWICQSFGAMPLIAASVHCLPSILWHLCIGTYCFLSIWGLFKAMQAKSPWQRRLCFSPPFMMRMLVVILRSFGIGGGNPKAFVHVVLQDLVAVVGGMIGALRVPEKWMPGQLDLLLNSHNIMHVMVVLAVISMHAATMQDLAWMIDPEVCAGGGVGPTSPALHEEL